MDPRKTKSSEFTTGGRIIDEQETNNWKRQLQLEESDPELDLLMKRNADWAERTQAEKPFFFSRLARGQSPKYLYFGCSDSRVPANTVLGLEAGDVFVHRNVGNIVIGSDLNSQTVLEYAVAHLKVQHIIVAGHYDCGAVHASVKQWDLGLIENWLRSIRDVYRLHQTELDAITDATLKHRRLVELNVIEQCLNVYKSGVVQRRRIKTYKDPDAPFAAPRIHGLVFDPATGLMKKLDIDFKSMIKNFSHVYDLYDAPEEGHHMLKKPGT